MGGKTKQSQRTKNNVKPSSSSRSAELLGSAKPSFVGFSAHSDLGLIPFAPGFASAEQMPDSFDVNVSPQFQLIMRKMGKKDPMTKKKGLQEFIELVNTSDIETLKQILPLWPKYYHNLAGDTEHNVRELSQQALQLLVSKCKRAIAPYLKQLVPVWLVSHFDNYAPAASIASSSFRDTFVGSANRIQEVCLHCQTEILEYTGRNLTFHTASTLSTGKNLSAEESEQKYMRTVICSLKALSFFVEHTRDGLDLVQVEESFRNILKHQKFWSFSKHKNAVVKAAWFELIYQILQTPDLSKTIEEMKSQVISVSFQNLDESDPLVAPSVWGCILVLQTTYDDWFSNLEVMKVVLPKISFLLRSGFNKNTQAICPNMLPFFSKLSQDSLQDVNWHVFCKQFFDDMIGVIYDENTSLSKTDYNIIIKTYFECIRFVFQKLNNLQTSESLKDDEALAFRLLNENILKPLSWCLNSSGVQAKPFLTHTSALMAFWADRLDDEMSCLYTQLYDAFWKKLFVIIKEGIENKDVNEAFLEHILDLVHNLYMADSSLEEQRVKFVDAGAEIEEDSLVQKSQKSKDSKLTKTIARIERDLKQLVTELIRFCLENTKSQKSPKYISRICRLIKMFSDKEFYMNITDKGSIEATADVLVELIDVLNDTDCDDLMDLIFEILKVLEKTPQLKYIKTKLLKISNAKVQSLVLQRLLSYPLCIEPEVQTILSEQEASTIIIKIAHEAVENDSKDKFNMLHKCFFQTESGEILISSSTVDAILKIVSAPLISTELNESVDSCGSFVAQIMPVICSNNNSSKEMQKEVFLRFFKFTIEHTPNEFISEDTLWEITTCWEDALSSEDIIIDDELLKTCADIVEKRIQAEDLSVDCVDMMAASLAKLITCSTENLEDEMERFERIDYTMQQLFDSKSISPGMLRNVEELCLFLEAMKSKISTGEDVWDESIPLFDILATFRRCLLNFSTIFKLVCKVNRSLKPATAVAITDEEITDDYCDPNEHLLKNWSETLYTEILKYVKMAGAGDSLIYNATQLSKTCEQLMLELSEKVKLFMNNESDIIDQVKQRLLCAAAENADSATCRSLKFLINCRNYADFEENAPVILVEELSEYFLEQNALKAYVKSLQYFLPELQQRSISSQSAIMRTEPNEIWIKATVFQCLIHNNFDGLYNEKMDKAIMIASLQFITEIAEQQQTKRTNLLLYNVEIQKQEILDVSNIVEYINLLSDVIDKFPYELTIKNWDAVRIGLSSWVLSISKSIQYHSNPKVAIFVASVYKLFTALTKFISGEKQKSSTEFLTNVTDEWENLFAREVNLVLFKSFYSFCNTEESSIGNLNCFVALLEELIPAVELLDYSFVYDFCKNSTKITLDNVCNFLLKNLSNSIHSVRICCVFVLRQLTRFFVAKDIETFEKKIETIEGQSQITKWHYLNRFEDYIMRYDLPIRKYLKEFSFKLTEITDLEPIDRDEAFSYLLLWDCIIYTCANSPVSLRSVYTNWLNENKYEENLLHFLFRAMPMEILKNYDSKIMNSDVFKGLSWSQITDPSLSLEKYVCHVYTEVLRKFPAVVRKWWNISPSRQKVFVDKLTTNFVSPLICSEELKAIVSKKEKHENMQVTVHMSTREVLAVYSIDEARMELVITLAPNYPLGGVKVECGKQIGGRSTSRNVGMQLTIFLTHQNGTIFDGLSLWKNNLDKKFEGVEECYVCYTVIHQDTCQLPKLTCKTCKKKFHGPCLYKWFTTSSKSTCPICRNVF